MGKIFSWGAVLELVPDELRPRVGPILQGLVRRELIAPDHSATVGEDAFGFHHLLIQEAAYRQTPKELRADLHMRFAGWLERTAGERIGENEEILAYHLEQAARYRMELGPSDARIDALIERASGALASVGGRALARGDISAAASLLDARLRPPPERGPETSGAGPGTRSSADGDGRHRTCRGDAARRRRSRASERRPWPRGPRPDRLAPTEGVHGSRASIRGRVGDAGERDPSPRGAG